MKSLRSVFAIVALGLALDAQAEVLFVSRIDSAADPAAIAAAAGVAYRDRTPGGPFALFGAADGDVAAQTRLTGTAGVVWVEDNVTASTPENQSGKGSTVSAVGGRDDLVAINQNALGQIDWSSALASSPGRPVRIAILDTGLSKRQAYLWAKVDAATDSTASSISIFSNSRTNNPDDFPRLIDSNMNGDFDEAVGHGTMVAGIIDQVAPQVRFVIARVADSDGQATAWSIVKGIAFAVVNNAEVANISLASPEPIAALNDVIDWAEGNGLLPVVSIGNANEANAWYPARLSSVICVSGVDAGNLKAGFSNWDGGCDSSAPGVGIYSQYWDNTMAVWSGTSCSAPFVTGAIGDCLRRAQPQQARVLIQLVNNSGANLDTLNPLYRGKLGTLLDMVRLDAALQQP